MQPNTINLDVDYLNNASTTAEAYERFEEFQNRSIYIGANHSPALRDTISMYRSFPTKNGNFNGTQKTAVKLTLDVSVPGVDSETTLIAPAIVEVSFSVPVGVTQAEILKIRQRAIALLDLDTVMDPLNYQLMV